MSQKWFKQQARRVTKQNQAHSSRPRLEVLEDRIALATRIWDGNALSNNWSNAFNWAQDIAPSHGDDLVFPAGSFNDNKVADNDYAGTFNARSITFLGSGFTVRGNPINLGVGGTVDTSGSSNRITNDINLTGARTFNIGQGSTLFLDGEITGGSSSHITKTGAGDLSFEAQNGYFGQTFVNQGRLFAKKDTSLGLGGNGTSVSAGATLLVSDNVVGAMHVDEQITVATDGVLRVLGNVDLEGSLLFDNESLFLTEGPTNVYGTASFSRSGVDTFSGSIVVDDDGHDVFTRVSILDKLKFFNTVTLKGGITKFNGSIDQELEFAGLVEGPGALYLNVGYSDTNPPIHGTTFSGPHHNTYSGSTVIYSNPVFLKKPADIVAIPSGPVINMGLLKLFNHGQISSGARLRVDGFYQNDALDLNGYDNTIDTLTITSHGQVKSTSLFRKGVLTVVNQITGIQLQPERPGTFLSSGQPLPSISCDLYIGSAVKSILIGDDTLLISGRITGTGGNAGIIKNGAGTLVLTGNNTYEGNTFVNEGNLRIHGNQPNSKAVVNGGRLLGTGTIGGLSVYAGGRVKPGSIGGFGILHVAGDVSFLAGSILEVSLNSPIAGSGYDQIDVDGPGTSGLGSGIVHFNGAIVQPFVGLGNAIGDTFRIIDNDDSDQTTGETFASATQASVPQGGILTAPGGERFSVNYFGSIGNNDVVLNRTTAGALFPNRSVTPVINEGGFVTLTGKVSDPDRMDTFILHINWGDGSPVETKVYPPSFNGKQVSIRHRYRQDRSDPYQIDLSWHDQRGAGNTGTLLTKVNDVAPRLSAPGPVVRYQNQIVSQLIKVTELGTDLLRMTVDYGDGLGEQEAQIDTRTKTALLQHRYSLPGQFQVVVTVRDQDNVATTTSFDVTILAKSFNQPGLLSDLFFSQRS